MSETGYVYYLERLAGKVERRNGRYYFEYLDDYINDPSMPSISVTFPKQEKIFESDVLFPFFFGLLAEGELMEMQCRLLRIDEKDHFTRLRETAGWETIGAITVRKHED
ncbi:MAG: HipA N-terminal domain-containing protein [Ignavibacteriales bacterium]|nr:HipA N-terminal domain-containing protein [Ignavibacteriales bacterium]